MKKLIYNFFLLSASIILCFNSCSTGYQNSLKSGIVIENRDLRLVIGNNGKALSLVHKRTGQECLQPESKRCNNASVFSITEYMPYNNEIHLVYPSKTTTFEADSVYRSGDDLIVRFERSKWVATIGLKITDRYIGFTLKKLDIADGIGDKTQNPIDEFTILQLPVRYREYFGDWLNVVWDNDIAVNVLGTDPYPRVDAVKYKEYAFLQATAVRQVKMMNVGAALITTDKNKLLDCIDQLEQDYNLPLGVKSRRNKEIRYSYLWLGEVTPKEIDDYIAIAKKGGFGGIQIYWPAIFKTLGHYPWRPEYPNGMKDLQTIVHKIKEAGMIAGFHFQHSKASIDDIYVTPVPDHRLNLIRQFTLAAPLDKKSTTVNVEESPEGCDLITNVMWDKKQILKIGNELIEYTNYTTDRPYKFNGCKRGILNTRPDAYISGYKFGLLDIDGQPAVRFDQRTSIQQEHAERIAKISNEAGFQFFSYDGAEDVHAPWWFYVSMSQYEVHKRLVPEPLFSTGAAKSHFDWHILTCSNEFDTFRPEEIKEATRKYQATAAKYLAQDFSRVNLGWIDYVAPSEKTIGMQPDMYEYICSCSAAWDCPISLKGRMNELKEHPRTNDNLEVIRRWEQARLTNYFTDEQIKDLKNLNQEHILLINETGGFELQRYTQMHDAAGGNSSIRAFIFDRSGKTYVVFWHPYGKGRLKLKIDAGKVHLFKVLGKEIPVEKDDNSIIVNYGDRQYFEIDLPRNELLSIFRDAKIL